MRWFCLGLMFWLGCGGDPKPPETSVKPAVFELIDEGSGEANVEPVWPLNAGSYIEGSYSVESKHGAIYRVLLLETPRAFIQPRTQITDVQRWTKSEHGLALVSSVAEGEPSAPLVIVPASIRNGMSWRTSDGFIASVTIPGQQDTVFGSKTIWAVTLVRENDGYMLSFVFAEGLGPHAGSLNSGVLVVEDDSNGADTFFLPNAQAPILFDNNTPRVSAGIYDLGAIDVEGAPFVFTARAFYKPVGAQAFDFRDADHCMLVEPSGQLTTIVEEAEVRIPSVGTCPVNVFPGLGDSRLFSSPALATPSGSGGVLWFKDGIDVDANGTVDVAYSLPHFVDGVLRAFERVQLNVSSIIPLIDAAGDAVQSEILEIYRTTHTAAYDDAAEGHLRIGMDFDSESAPLRYLTVDDAWITANTIEGSQPQLGGESWFIPGRHSVRTHDNGREVLLARIDGVVLKIDTDGNEVRSSIVAHAAPVDDGLFTGAVRHPSGIALSVNVPESIVSTVPFVKVPTIDTDFDLPSSFAFRAQRHGNGFLVCYPKRFAALSDLKLRSQGQDAMAIYQSGFADGCGLVTFENELPQNTAIEATLPEVGRILASTDNIINVVGTSDFLTIPLRGSGFVAPRFSMDDVGLVTEISEVPRISVGDGRPRFRDLGGHGYWIYTTDENGYVTTLRLSNVSGVSWPTLPFRAQTVSNNLTFKSIRTDGVAYVCGPLPSGDPGCFSVDKSGTLETIPYAQTMQTSVVLDDATRCYVSNRVWCGQAQAPAEAPTTPMGLVEAVVPQGNGFYLKTTYQTYYFNAANNVLTALTDKYESLHILGDDLVVGVYEGWLIRLEGTTETVVFNQYTSLGLIDAVPMLPGRNTVLVGATPIFYDPTAN